MVNKVILLGRLDSDPELRHTANGTAVANLRIATDESYTDRDGNKVDRTEWHNVVVFHRQAENCNTHLMKGSLVFVEGSLRTRKWQDNQGHNRYTTKIHATKVLLFYAEKVTLFFAENLDTNTYQEGETWYNPGLSGDITSNNPSCPCCNESILLPTEERNVWQCAICSSRFKLEKLGIHYEDYEGEGDLDSCVEL